MSMLVNWLKYLKNEIGSLIYKINKNLKKHLNYIDVSTLDPNNEKLSISSVIYIATENL